MESEVESKEYLAQDSRLWTLGSFVSFYHCTMVAAEHSNSIESQPFLSGGTLWMFAAIWLILLASFSAPEESSFGVSESFNAMAKVKIAIRALVVGTLGLMLLTKWRQPQARSAVRVFLPLAVFACWAILSTLWSPLKMVSLGQAAGIVALLMIALLVAVEYRGASSTSALLGVLSFGLLSLSSLLLVARFAYPTMQSMTREGTGLFHATNAAATASLGILLLLSAKLLWNWPWSRLLIVPGIAVHSLVLVMSQNRTSLVLTCLVAGYLLLRYGNPGFVGAWILVVSTGIAIYLAADPGFQLVTGASDDLAEFALRDQSLEQLSNLSGRNEMWAAMWASFLESPLIGHGYFVSSRTGSIDVWYEEGNWTAHNMTLQSLVSIGIIGTTFLFLGLCSCFRPLLPGTVRDAQSLAVVRLARILLLWYVGWGLFNESILGPLQPECVVFFVMAGLTVGVVARQRATATSSNLPIQEESDYWTLQPIG